MTATIANKSAEDRFGARQSRGERDYQEDDFGFLDARSDDTKPEHALLVVADGMGGHANGARASAIVTEAFIDLYQQSGQPSVERLDSALRHANNCLAAAIKDEPALEGMGTTLVAVAIQQESLHWVSVGDSPLWLFRSGKLSQLNADHSMAPLLQQMVEQGRISAEEAAADPKRNSLLSALMGSEIELIDLPTEPVPCLPGDLLVLASDGLQTLTDAEIESLVGKHRHESAARIGEALIEEVAARKNPRQDNVTVLVYRPAVNETVDAAPVGEPTATAIENPAVNVGAHKTGVKQAGFIVLVLLALVALAYLISLSLTTR